MDTQAPKNATAEEVNANQYDSFTYVTFPQTEPQTDPGEDRNAIYGHLQGLYTTSVLRIILGDSKTKSDDTPLKRFPTDC